jgi:hypothetical protein
MGDERKAPILPPAMPRHAGPPHAVFLMHHRFKAIVPARHVITVEMAPMQLKIDVASSRPVTISPQQAVHRGRRGRQHG